MGTKTISLKDEAYRRLKAARRYPDESFSEVVLRATWPEDTVTAAASKHAHLTAAELDQIEAAKRADVAPEDKWSGN
jgi:predicted CopG family antitoxin